MMHLAIVNSFFSISFCMLKFLSLSTFTWKVQGRDRAVVKSVAEHLGLEGSYIPRTYIEQIQLEKLVNEVMV